MQYIASEFKVMLKLNTSLEINLSSHECFPFTSNRKKNGEKVINNRILMFEETPVNQQFFQYIQIRFLYIFQNSKKYAAWCT